MENMLHDAEKVLDFWITMENVQQDEFPAETRWFKMPKKRQKRFHYSKVVEWDKNLSQFFGEMNEKFHFAAHGAPTFFVGKLDLEPCLYELASCLNQNYQPVERNRGKIAAFAITLSSEFRTVESFSFSPILREICLKKGIDVTEDSSIQSDLQELLDNHTEKMCIKDFDREKEDSTGQGFMLSFSVFQEYLVKILESVLGSWYEARNGTSQGKTPVVLLDCILYDMEITMNISDEPPSPRLSSNFFSADLQLLRSRILHDKAFSETPMGKDVLKYLVSVSPDDHFDRDRSNLVPNPSENEDAEISLRSSFDSVLHPSMAPLGKWPGRYMPVLMQEVAINAYTKRFLGNSGRIFSVNGPPGTGKTTLLKEIIAEHIVERANLLAAIEKPDDAFDVVPFQKQGGYDQYKQKYSRFKPSMDAVHNYSILITSSNNKAVENISKELPQTKSVLESFEGIEKSSLHPAIIGGMIGTRDLFTKGASGDSIPCLLKTSSEEEGVDKKKVVKEVPDIYFSRYADMLLGDEENAAWGLISCALGKKDNINQFVSILWKLLSETFPSKENFYEHHVASYQRARQEFLAQYKKTKEIQQSLCDAADQNKQKYSALDDLIRKMENLQASIHRDKENILRLEENSSERQKSLDEQENQLRSVWKSKDEQAPAARQAFSQMVDSQKQNLVAIREQFQSSKSDLMNAQLALEQQELSIKSLQCDIDEKILLHQKLQDSMPNSLLSFFSSDKKALRKEIRKKIANLDQEVVRLSKEKTEIKHSCIQIKQQIMGFSDTFSKKEQALSERQNALHKLEEALASDTPWKAVSDLFNDEAVLLMAKLENQEAEILREIQKIKTDIEALDSDRKKMQAHRMELQQSIEKAGKEKAALIDSLENESPVMNEKESDQYTALSIPFFRKLASKDIDDSTWAQLQNPWLTENFNREREKLFRLALRLQREFILSSSACCRNLRLIREEWGKPFLNEVDRETVMPELFRTLWLLVPVISTTFASVGRFFQNARMPGLFGTLVVDEAGQASPQMAVGALYRARRAIIVGDPNQVEPVVTDALDIIRHSYDDPFFKSYQLKALSVQQFADCLNPLGTYLKNINGEKEWVGCPLLVHRRCIDPMYSISNELSYNGIMKLQTAEPSEKKRATFIHDFSTWFDIKGKETGEKGNHFVKAQGDFVLKLLEVAFKKSDFPSLYIISPFKSVAEGVKSYIKENASEKLRSYDTFSKWVDGDSSSAQIGTVHTFQGKEANEVIFLLGCDKDAGGAIGFVNPNIVNVAATRAKYRLYVVGDKDIWMRSACVSFMTNFLPITLIQDEDSHETASDADGESKIQRVIIKNDQIKNYFRHALGLVPGRPGTVEELDIISPWISPSVIEDTDAVRGYNIKESFKNLLEKNVTIKIIYGISSYGNKEQRKREDATKACVNKLKEWFGSYPNFKTKEANTHRKLFLCDDRFYVLSSMNILSNKGNFENANSWSEGGEASKNKKIIQEYRERDFNF